VGGNELEEIESDVFRAARCGVAIAGFHMSLSEHVAKGDGSGSAEKVATYGRPRPSGAGRKVYRPWVRFDPSGSEFKNL